MYYLLDYIYVLFAGLHVCTICWKYLCCVIFIYLSVVLPGDVYRPILDLTYSRTPLHLRIFVLHFVMSPYLSWIWIYSHGLSCIIATGCVCWNLTDCLGYTEARTDTHPHADLHHLFLPVIHAAVGKLCLSSRRRLWRHHAGLFWASHCSVSQGYMDN